MFTLARLPHRLVDRQTRMALKQLSVRCRLFACSTAMSIEHSQGGTERSAFVSRDEQGCREIIWRNKPNFPMNSTTIETISDFRARLNPVAASRFAGNDSYERLTKEVGHETLVHSEADACSCFRSAQTLLPDPILPALVSAR
jgi:hypothetical protein